MKRRKTIKIKKGEKLLQILIVLSIIMYPVITVATKSLLSSTNIELEKIKSKVEKEENVCDSLEMQVNELASLSSIQDVAKEYGLSYNNDNIIVIK